MSLPEILSEVTDSLKRWIIPELQYSQSHYEEHLRRWTSEVQSWLDLGCGYRLLSWRPIAIEKELVESVPHVVGIDYDYNALREHKTIRNLIRGNISSLPFKEMSFSLVTANMVVEHLDDPVRQFCEIARVLEPGGVFLFHTPNLQSYVIKFVRLLPPPVKKILARVLEGRKEKDVYPTHYRANTEQTIFALAESAGLEVLEINFIASLPAFTYVPPLAALELLYLRQLVRQPALVPYRQTLICALRRPNEP